MHFVLAAAVACWVEHDPENGTRFSEEIMLH